MGEYYFVLLVAVFGAMLMVSSSHFLMIFLSLETLSVSPTSSWVTFAGSKGRRPR